MEGASNEYDHHARENKVINQLSELFGVMLSLDVIESVARNCNYNIDMSSNYLLEIANGMFPANGFEVVNKKETDSASEQWPQDKFPSPVDERYKKELDLQRIIEFVKEGWKVLILLRGLPGSGKSYIAQTIITESIKCYNTREFVLSTDDYFCRSGDYNFDPNSLQEAHDWNQRRCFSGMRRGLSPIIIDNTNTRLWEMRPYCLMAAEFGYCIEVVEPSTPWAFNVQILEEKNIHRVSRAKLIEMLARYEQDLTPDKISRMCDLRYRHVLPQYRKFPPLNRQKNFFESVTAESNNNVISSMWRNTPNRVNSASDVDHVRNEVPVEYVHDFGAKCETSEVPTENIGKSTVQEYIHKFETTENMREIQQPGEKSLQEKLEYSIDDLLMFRTGDKAVKTNSDDDLNVLLVTTSIAKPRNVLQNMIHSKLNLTVHEEIKSYDNKNSAEITTNTLVSTTGSEGGEGFKSLAMNAPDQKKREKDPYFSTSLEAWGLTEKALVSWDVVSPLSVQSLSPEVNKIVTEPIHIKKSDQYTNTSAFDFNLIKQGAPQEGVVVLTGKNRNITHGIVPKPLTPPKKTLVDKSSMTNEEVLVAALKREKPSSENLQKLEQLFPDIPKEYLIDIYDKCIHDINWTVDLLMENGLGNLSSQTICQEQGSKVENSLDKMEQEQEEQMNKDLINFNSDIIDQPHPDNDSADQTDKEIQKQQERAALKRYLEETVDLKKEHYSEKLWRIISQKRGTPTKTNNLACAVPSTSQNEITCDDTAMFVSDEEDDATSFDDGSSEGECENLIEVNLGQQLTSQLEKMFGDSEPSGFEPVVQMPASFARQLHALYLESVCRQIESQSEAMEVMMKEDEAYAKKLQEEEEVATLKQQRQQVCGLKEIMDEQVALNLYQKDVDLWKNMSPDDLASKLTRQKLCETFPTIEKELLVEILQAHNNCYGQTVETLLDSTDPKNIHGNRENLREPPVSDTMLQEMKLAQEEVTKVPVDNEQVKSAESYRAEANEHMLKRRENLQKVNMYQQRGMHEVAAFYGNVARQQLQLGELANQKATCRFLEENAVKLTDATTLDLHYLYVKEALPTLDIFIDHHISRLNRSKKTSDTLFIITGRGKRSEGGISRLKPAVINRLKKREINYFQVNLGLLKIKIHKKLLMSTNLEKLK